MAWLQSHQSLGQHPKLRRLSALLGVSKAQAVGHLHCLWWWCLDYAPSGDLVKYEEIDIALAAEWTGDVADFIDGMERAGFLDRGEHGVAPVGRELARRLDHRAEPVVRVGADGGELLPELGEHVGEEDAHRVPEQDRVRHLHHRGLEVEREEHVLRAGLGDLLGEERNERVATHEGGVDDLARP